MVKRKILLAIADGLGDRPIEKFDQQTPLQYAKKKNLNHLAKNGSCGIMDLHKAGTPVGTDLGHMILFGYSLSDYPGRGPIEAYGDGFELNKGDVAIRCNFATIDEDWNVLDRRAGRIRKGTSELAKSLNGLEILGVKISFKEATEHRATLILRGLGLSDMITDTDPKGVNIRVRECKSRDGDKKSLFTAKVINEFLKVAHNILKNHPINAEREKKGELAANCILTRGAGQMPNLEKTTRKYGFRAACVAGESTVLGAGKIAGFIALTDTSFTGNMDTNFELKAKMALSALEDYDFVAVHFKATDLMGHDNNPDGKVKAIEVFDKMMGVILEKLGSLRDNTIIALAADHSTPCERMEHSGDPVPIVISGPGIRRDTVVEYDEISCSRGALLRISGNEFFNTLLDYMELSKKEGN
ncbi:MAG: 2,3-bisphosphoglycerate-independent phosphoglycerate mutase [Tissierellia bacterium]|nr:2,3-bisphosphoglycerate-independent phosphoglycerate mutase [Tissierellia bacterium]